MLRSTGIYIGLAAVLGFVAPTAFAETASPGCGRADWGSGSFTMLHEEILRTFRVHVPGALRNDHPAPLVMMFHGWGGNEDEFIGSEVIRSEADERGYILVAPRGLGSGEPDQAFNSWTFSGSASGLDGDGFNPGVAGDSKAICDATLDQGITPDYRYPSCKDQDVAQNSCSWTQCQQDDVEFVIALVAEVGKHLCVDTERLFATGSSNGGMLTWELGQNRTSAPLFRAIAPVIGLPHRGYLGPPGTPVNADLPVILITGTRDSTVPPGAWDDPGFTTTSNDNDRFYYTGATAITGAWARAHDCRFDPEEPARPFKSGAPEADCRTYCSSDPGWPRVLDCRADMGHSYGLPWSWRLVLDFFDAHSGT